MIISIFVLGFTFCWLSQDVLRITNSSSWSSPPIFLLHDMHTKLLDDFDCQSKDSVPCPVRLDIDNQVFDIYQWWLWLPWVSWMESPFPRVSSLVSNWLSLTYTWVSRPLKFGCLRYFGWITNSWSPWGRLTQTLPCRTSKQLIRMCKGMEDSTLWRKMRKVMMRTGRSETRSGGLTEFIVYKDLYCIEFNKLLVGLFLYFTKFHFNSSLVV